MSDISVLFAVDAEELLEKGMTSESIELCKLGIAAYPDYFAGYSLLIKALLQNKMYDDALIYIELAGSIFPQKPAISDFRNEVDNLSEESIPDPLAIEEVDDSLLVMTDEDLDIEPQSQDSADEPPLEINDDSIYSLLHQNDDFEQIDDDSIDYVPEVDDVIVDAPEVDDVIVDDFTDEENNSNESFVDELDDDSEPLAGDDEFELNDLILMIGSDDEILADNSNKFSDLLANIGDSAIDDIIALSSEISDEDTIDEPTKILDKGFLKQLASIDENHSEIEYPISANDKEIIAGLYDYGVNEHNSSSKLRYDAIISAGFDIKSIEEKYSKKATNKDDFAILAEKIKLIDIKPVERTFDEAYDDESYGDEIEFEAIAPATETMANIFVLQQAYPKAEKIYRQLIGSNPEKTDYYLQKIDSFKDKIASEKY